MILTGRELAQEVQRGIVVIDPFNPVRVEANSYGFTLGTRLLACVDEVLDVRAAPRVREIVIPNTGYLLEPDQLYLGVTAEKMGSHFYAATLDANRSMATLGAWIQYSAPLGHTGAIIPWTLEIRVAQPLRVYPGLLIGKIAFWKTNGVRQTYQGHYTRSATVRASRLSAEFSKH